MKALSKENIILFLLLFTLRLTGQDIRDLLPGPDDLPGWKLNQEPQIYEGDRLFELIDGGADIYIEYGFRQVVSSQFTDPSNNNILVEIYEMNDAAAAYGIFSITQQTVNWTEQFGNIAAVSADYIAFWKGKYYVNLSWSSRQHIDEPVLSRLAAIVSGNITDKGDYPGLLKGLPAFDQGIKTIYFKGNLGLSNFYYFDYKDIFNVEDGLARTIGNQHRIIFKYGDPEVAEGALASAKQCIEGSKRFIDIASAFKGFSCRDNKGNLILTRQVEEYVVILVGLNQEDSLAPTMDEISQKIESISR
jgi:hypothetical protein